MQDISIGSSSADYNCWVAQKNHKLKFNMRPCASCDVVFWYVKLNT